MPAKPIRSRKSKNPGVAGLPVPLDSLNARPDTVDFRDKMYVPTLVEVPLRIPLEQYLSYYPKADRPRVILNQGKEGACTGFGLAAVANFLLRRRKVVPDPTPVSPRMLYEMARRYDEWPGEDYSGSSARGAMKGWHKHGVCAGAVWPYDVAQAGVLSYERTVDAARRPLGAYFRVNHRDLVSMHSALAEVGIVYATANVHEGWGQVDPKTGEIPVDGKAEIGGHAFAVVGYDERGFWIQNSWGPSWGYKSGFALVTYDDWLVNSTDVWVARLGAAVRTAKAKSKSGAFSSLSSRADYSFNELRPHVISIGNDGALRPSGTFSTTAADVESILTRDFPRITAGWKKKRLLLYAHGGLVGEEGALQRVEDYRRQLLAAEVYPLAFIWKTDFWTTISNILKDAFAKRRTEGWLDAAKDFLLDRIDDTLEPLARPLGKTLWDEMKENGLKATTARDGGAALVLKKIDALLAADPTIELHVAGHSAGSIFMAPLVQLLTSTGKIADGPARGLNGLGRPVKTCTLWAAACTVELFKEAYLPAIRAGAIGHFTLFNLKDGTEQDDHCANVYHKSLLYLVSNACERRLRLFRKDGEPILGMEKFIVKDPVFAVEGSPIAVNNPHVVPLFGMKTAQMVRAPNGLPEGDANASHSRHHGDFDDDLATAKATLARILNASQVTASFGFRRSAASLADRRRCLGIPNLSAVI